MQRHLLILIVPFVLGSCNPAPENRDKIDSTSVDDNRFVAKVSDIQSFRPQIDLTPWEGDLYDAIYWKDTTGEHVLIVSGTSQYLWKEQKPELQSKLRRDQDPEKYSNATEIFARHYILKSGEAKWNLRSEYYNHLFSSSDVLMGYQKNSLTVADVDSNGVGEALFLYLEAEGGSLEKHDYSGKMILFHDSIARVSVGPMGLAAANSPPPQSMEEKVHLVCPDEPQFRTFLLNQWDIYFKEQERIDRESITERSNVDEHGHADHVH